MIALTFLVTKIILYFLCDVKCGCYFTTFVFSGY